MEITSKSYLSPLSTPKGDGSFNVYDDIRTKLLAAGVPESEVEFIHNADTEGKKADLFSKVRSGKVRVLLGSTAKMGAGTNVQTLLVAVHHLDVGWRPSDMTQRNGRIIRQGNKNKQVYVYNYVTEGTFDAYLWQTLENKQKFISQIMTSKSPMRSCDDVDEQALSYAEVKALCAGDPRIREKMDLDVQVAKLKVLRSDYQNQKYRLEDKLLKHYPEEIQKAKNRIAALKNDAQIADAHPQDKENFCGMTIKGISDTSAGFRPSSTDRPGISSKLLPAKLPVNPDSLPRIQGGGGFVLGLSCTSVRFCLLRSYASASRFVSRIARYIATRYPRTGTRIIHTKKVSLSCRTSTSYSAALSQMRSTISASHTYLYTPNVRTLNSIIFSTPTVCFPSFSHRMLTSFAHKSMK